jgi:hypothetical protein
MGVLRAQRRRTTPPHEGGRRTLSAIALALLATASTVLAVGTTPAVARSAPHHARPPVVYTHPAESTRPGTTHTTTNNIWSGYVVTPAGGHQFASVSSTWVQKRVKCQVPDAWVLFWVGLDGWSSYDSSTVEQGGSSAECVNGVPQYEAWWEMYPTNSVQTTFPIAVGDTIESTVAYSATASTYTITVDDETSGNSLTAVSATPEAATNPNTYTVTVDGVTTGPVSYAPATVCSLNAQCENSSAEFVVEAPGGDGNAAGLYPLAHFRPFVFTLASVEDSAGDQGPISGADWQYTGVDMTSNSDVPEADVMPLRKRGTRFRVVWLSSVNNGIGGRP